MEANALIFDIDGTLWDSTAIVARGYNDYLAEIGHRELSVTPSQLKKLFGRTMTEIADLLFPQFPEEARYAMMGGCMDREHVFLEADPCDVAYPGVVRPLKRLAENHDLYIVSNSQKGYPDLLIQKLGIETLIRGHLCYGDTGASKGKTIRTLMERYGIGSAAYIGDTQGALEATREAGIPFVFCRYGFGNPEHWDAVIDSFEELTGIF